MALFPSGLTFTPARTTDVSRRVRRISGEANLSSVVGAEEQSLPSKLRPRRDSNPSYLRRVRLPARVNKRRSTLFGRAPHRDDRSVDRIVNIVDVMLGLLHHDPSDT